MTSRSRESPAILLLPERPFAHHSLIGNQQRETSMNEETVYEDEVNETHREIQEECQEYGENTQRSENDGWFYSNGDE